MPRSSSSPKKNVTMRDVARMANVSQSTVSRVLSGVEGGIPIGEETRRRVLEAVETLGYYPNLHAGSLRGQKTFMIAMMIADIGNPFYHPMVRAVQDVAHVHRYDVMIANSDHTREGEEMFLESVIRRPVDGVIMVPYHLGEEELELLIERTGAAVVVLGQQIRHPRVDVVFGRDDRAMFEATTWLIQEKGHRRIGFIGVTEEFSAGARRKAAFLKALQQAHLPIEPELFEIGDWSVESGARAVQKFLSLTRPPTAVFAINDLMAIGAMEAAQAQGICIPDEMAVIGFDDIPQATWVRPRLTTVAQYPAEMGRRMAEALFERIQKEYTGAGRRFEMPCRLVIRESV